MTQDQQYSINKIYKSYLENKQRYVSYVSDDYCDFTLYKNESVESDKNIVGEWTRISDLSEQLLPQTETLYFLIEPTGFYYDMASLKNLFSSMKEMYRYIDNLTKFKWDGK